MAARRWVWYTGCWALIALLSGVRLHDWVLVGIAGFMVFASALELVLLWVTGRAAPKRVSS